MPIAIATTKTITGSVAGLGYALLGKRRPLSEQKNLWPTKKDIDWQLLFGALLFGVGWGVVGLCLRARARGACLLS
jgi:uncharacterized membrane protein YedE/YeeE